MADAATLSVITSGVVGALGVGGVLYGARITLRNQDRNRAESRRDDLRSVMDDAARAAMRYRATLARLSAVEPEDDDAQLEADRTILARLVDGVSELIEMLARLGVRLGPDHPVVERYDEFVTLAGGMTDTVRDFVRLYADAQDVTPAVRKARLEQLDAASDEGLDGLHTRYDEFVRACAARVGSE